MQSTHKCATNINFIYKLYILCIYSNGKFKNGNLEINILYSSFELSHLHVFINQL